MRFLVGIEPTGKARPRLGRGGHVFTPKKTVDAERAIAAAFHLTGAEMIPEGTPVMLEVTAYFSIPKSWPEKKREAAMAGELLPTKKPDADNILKLVADALNGVAYADDAQIVRSSVWKEYSKAGLAYTGTAGYLAIEVGAAL